MERLGAISMDHAKYGYGPLVAEIRFKTSSFLKGDLLAQLQSCNRSTFWNLDSTWPYIYNSLRLHYSDLCESSAPFFYCYAILGLITCAQGYKLIWRWRGRTIVWFLAFLCGHSGNRGALNHPTWRACNQNRLHSSNLEKNVWMKLLFKERISN